MATYTGGLKIPKGLKLNGKEADKFINNAISRAVQHSVTVGNKINKELRKESVIQWFRHVGFPNSYHTMLKSLAFDYEIQQKKTQISIIFYSYVDQSLYDIESTSLYRQRKKYGNLNATAYIVESLQWNRGILGLPMHSDFGYSDWENNEDNF